ncbi:hypothetical protein RRG08_047129 [Elysia crispata]|uniref:Uncharacterized protein n=1 Tax=Elysia crispata TaxID=231223 RepID=A0AAE1E1U6_9GAST|nr:hypothetical protein RRG08_047129 [Elysia crispata]
MFWPGRMRPRFTCGINFARALTVNIYHVPAGRRERTHRLTTAVSVQFVSSLVIFLRPYNWDYSLPPRSERV